MKIEYRTGDLLRAPERHLLHCCNSLGKMGKGVALAIKEAYPAAYQGYMRAFENEGLSLGTTIWIDCGRHVVVHLIGQSEIRRPGMPPRVFVDYEALRSGVREVDDTASAVGIEAVAMPLIGAGLAGGSWQRIASILEEESRNFRPVVYTLDGSVPNG